MVDVFLGQTIDNQLRLGEFISHHKTSFGLPECLLVNMDDWRPNRFLQNPAFATLSGQIDQELDWLLAFEAGWIADFSN